MPYRAFTLCLACALTAACGGQGSTSSGGFASSPPPNTSAFPQTPAFNAADFRAAVADDQRAQFLDETNPNNIPLGRATYDGHIRSEALVNGADGYDIIGDLRLDIDVSTRQPIAGRNTVDGAISGLTLIDRFEGDAAEALDGRLSIAGDVTSGEIEATARGTIARDRLGSRFDDTSQMAITLDGSLRDDFRLGDVATGDIGGGTTGDSRNDFDINLVGEGQFYAED